LLPYLQNTNYKNSKLNKYYIKQFGNYKNDPKQPGTVSGRLLELLEQWWHVAPLATATDGAWIHAPPPMKVAETGGSGTSSSSLSPYAGSDLQQQQKRNNQLILVFISFVFVLLRFFLLFVRSGFYFSSSRFRIRFFLHIGLLCVSFSSPLHSSGGGVVGVAAMVQALMIFAPFGRSGGGRGRSAGVRSVQRRAGG
jgi:hypothetical protein